MISPFFDSFHQPDTETIITIATYMVPGGALFVLVVEQIINTFQGKSVFLVHILGALYGGLMFVPLLWVQLLTTAVYGFYRALLYSVIAAFNINVFGVENTGRINGVMYTLTGLPSFIIAPALRYAQVYCGDDWNMLLMWQFVAMVPSLAMAILLYFTSIEPFVSGKNAKQPPVQTSNELKSKSPLLLGATDSNFGVVPGSPSLGRGLGSTPRSVPRNSNLHTMQALEGFQELE